MADWTRASTEAAAIAGAWEREGGPGGAIVLFDTDGIRAQHGGGLASLEHAVPFRSDTPTRYASISKHILAALLLLEGVDLAASLGSLVPGLPAEIGAVPVERALGMTAALPDMMEFLWQAGTPFTASLSSQEIMAAARRLPGLNAAPGSEMAYSNTGWRLAQAILPVRGRLPYEAAVDHLMGGLGLGIAVARDETVPVPGLATGYWRDAEGAWRRGRYGFHFSASGGLAGSAADLARWLAALVAGRGLLAGLLPRLAAPLAFAGGTPSLYRLGLVETRLGATRILAHGGSLPGYRNHVVLAPEAGVGVVLLTNREEDALWPALRVLSALTGEAVPTEADDGPVGLYAAETGPVWAEFSPGWISFMGGAEALVRDGATIRSIPAYLDVRLDRFDEAVAEGLIGGAARRLHRVPAETPLDRRLVGHWRAPGGGPVLDIQADGTARMPGTGEPARLTPLPGARALADMPHGPWRHRPCLSLEADGSLTLASHRSRVLSFARSG